MKAHKAQLIDAMRADQPVLSAAITTFNGAEIVAIHPLRPDWPTRVSLTAHEYAARAEARAILQAAEVPTTKLDALIADFERNPTNPEGVSP